MQDDTRQSQTAATGGAAQRAAAPGDALREAGQDLRATAAQAGAQAGAQASEAVSRVRDEAAGAAADVKAEVSSVAGAVQERAAGFAEEQKQAGAEQAESLARAVRRAADELQGSAPQLAHYVREAADSTGQLAHALRNRSVGDLVSGVEDFARRQPVAFFGASVLAGFALARFVKSSADDAHAGRGGGQATAGSGASTGSPALHTSASNAPGWVPVSGEQGGDPPLTRPATMAAASLGGAAAHHASGSNKPGPGQSS